MRRFVNVAVRQRGAAIRAALVTAQRQQATATPRAPLHLDDSFLSGAAANYIEDLYLQWKESPASITDADLVDAFRRADTVTSNEPLLQRTLRVASKFSQTTATPGCASSAGSSSIFESERVLALAKEYARDGHLLASIDPLSLSMDRSPEKVRKSEVNLNPQRFGFTEADLDRRIPVSVMAELGGIFGDAATQLPTLRETLQRLEKAYTGNVSVEYTHIYDVEPCAYLREAVEGSSVSGVGSHALRAPITSGQRESILRSLSRAVQFESFLQRKFRGVKRFGVDGGESTLLGLHALMDRAAGYGVREFIVGMAHRGRLNVLCNVAAKPIAELMKEFNKVKAKDVDGFLGQGDVKYHNGWMGKIRTHEQQLECDMWLHHNPSHLECVNPFVQGSTRAAQFVSQGGCDKVLPIEIHGDASIAGQGVVYETMGLAGVGLNQTGGTIHLVINNQVGFTTDPRQSRCATHCTDIGRVFQIPVLHVNGDSPEDVYRVFQLAADFRKQFNRSVLINLVVYRRYGHNESDDPTVTQPIMYQSIQNRPDVLKMYVEKLKKEQLLPVDTVDRIVQAELASIEQAAKGDEQVDYLAAMRRQLPQWAPYTPATEENARMLQTHVTPAEIAPVVAALTKLPEGFTLHSNLKEILRRRTTSLEKGVDIDWGTAEALAFGTLLNEGTHIRISGQDVERATFSQRHAVVHDQLTDATYTALTQVSTKQAPFHIQNSTLSEFGVLGFEVGYGAYIPSALVMWEAQFADFANGAQVIFDQFLSAAESKWGQQCNIICSLPHGYDGAGPEHSSGRLERFLQSVSEDDQIAATLTAEQRHFRNNMEVAVPTTPKQYFHLLRRHVRRNFRKPLFIFFSKAYLRAPNVSRIEEFTSGGFQPVIDDARVGDVSQVTRLILCSGQVYFILDAARNAAKVENVAIIRVEQLAPFPKSEVSDILRKYPNAKDIVWAQDEPRNMGAWCHVEARLGTMMGDLQTLKFAGRLPSPSPATGYSAVHAHESAALCASALGNDTTSGSE